ncbi:mitochondrial 54S ribosomal protein mL50 MRPL13 KNAG_0A06880 [Huiozyma naganishii CBS 8797]|uniref:Large ribosomal subunit protein mL50 n=1 Tax=Huiozyma naganishii (strain ATCC MYA-139 / BCRC 22969 / CBS 8797 / KCTC 17520 / NBRC 10181 / NCYC 3082 / Yp74L-3) TaxID=1071383 RepID=J7RU51_HUIN7|nr:hypothetical protein KNAG_0A06880 [Kazachstania naganishii CBS 8797]CCK68342.1 hypothetical protein KNAG_0A06880 [Kazachstania naganishii CBS 8797]
MLKYGSVSGNTARVRWFGSSATRQDFMSWFRRAKKEKALAKEPVRSTQEVMSDIESGKAIKGEAQIAKLDLTRENFIGKRVRKVPPLKEIPYNHWLSAKKVTKENELDTVLLDAYNSSVIGVGGAKIDAVTNAAFQSAFSDLATKFRFVKTLQCKTGHPISDYYLTVLSTPSQFKEYYMEAILSGKLAKFNEKEPNAIEIKADTYKAPNIHVNQEKTVGQQMSKFSKILREVKAMERAATEEALERARRS